MTKLKTIGLSALSVTVAIALAACGGGGGDAGSAPAAGGGSGSSGGVTPPGTPGNVTSAQYAPGSVELAMFNQLAAYRNQCGFPAFQENTILDQAAAAHAQYMSANSVISDTEDASKSGFVGATYADRASHFGFPNPIDVGGVSNGYYTNAALTNDQYGNALLASWLAGVYHVALATLPYKVLGIGAQSTTFSGYPNWAAGITFGQLSAALPNAPLTFPCEGVTGVRYQQSVENPIPPNTSGAWGTPVSIVGNASDTVLMTSGTMTDTSGHVIALQVLDSSTDPNKLLKKFEGVAYPTTPLSPNTKYSVSLTGTINGTSFSRNFTFTTSA
ncbi:CAP domain-containing protein [Burkholderia vietnamiensis]|uniref:CAP domain-containing protein n=1 Tax=Burkholderia vietnamiensis TaxID=60552 RepID=UPI00158BE9BF|nr:CAP domain-containing protein [Burkholderia vietnamiensis]